MTEKTKKVAYTFVYVGFFSYLCALFEKHMISHLNLTT